MTARATRANTGAATSLPRTPWGLSTLTRITTRGASTGRNPTKLAIVSSGSYPPGTGICDVPVLPPTAVARDGGVRHPPGDDIGQHRAETPRRRWRDHLAARVERHGLQLPAIAQHGPDHMRRHEQAVVGDRSHRHRNLQRRRGHPLAEAVRGQAAFRTSRPSWRARARVRRPRPPGRRPLPCRNRSPRAKRRTDLDRAIGRGPRRRRSGCSATARSSLSCHEPGRPNCGSAALTPLLRSSPRTWCPATRPRCRWPRPS